MTAPQLPYYRAPEGLRARVEANLRRGTIVQRRLHRGVQWLGLAAMLVIAAGIGLRIGRRNGEDPATASVLSAHLRSLSGNHLEDVASSDQHTVKPWFAGKLDFSPPVVDPSASGFPLAGGRVDYIGGEPAAALVYTRRSHVINVFVQPLRDESGGSEDEKDLRGIHVVRWVMSGMQCWAVSDLNLAELRQLRALLTSGASAPPR